MTNKTLEEELTALDPPYETLEELKIGRTLDLYGIPFFYRQPTIVTNPPTRQHEIWRPSFTLPQYGGSVIDYLQEQERLQERIALYRYNHIPATVLGPQDLHQPHWRQDLYERIQQQRNVPAYGLDPFLQR